MNKTIVYLFLQILCYDFLFFSCFYIYTLFTRRKEIKAKINEKYLKIKANIGNLYQGAKTYIRADYQKLKTWIKKLKVLVKNNGIFLILVLSFCAWIVLLVLSVSGKQIDKNSEDFFPSDTLYSCYIAIFIGSITLYFTVFAFIKPKKLSFKYYKQYVINLKTKVLYILSAITFSGNTIIIFFQPFNLFFRIAITISIFSILLLLVQSIAEMNAMENEKMANKIFVKNVCDKILLKQPEDLTYTYALKIFENYIYPCFNKKSLDVIFQDYEKKINSLYNELSNSDKANLILTLTDCITNILTFYDKNIIDKIDKKEKRTFRINSVMDTILKNNLVFILKNYKTENRDKLIPISYSLYNIWFDNYKKLIFTKKRKSYESKLLEGVEPITYTILLKEKEDKDISNDFKNLYKNYLKQAFDICKIVLFQSDYLTFKKHLNDFIFTIQYLKHSDYFEDVVQFHDYYFVIIATYIANLYQEKRVSDDYLNLLFYIYRETKYIKIYFGGFIYEETLSQTGVHTIEKDTFYYFILSLIYTLSQIKQKEKKDVFIKNCVISKLDFSNNEENIYQSLLTTINSMKDIENCDMEDIELLKSSFIKKVNLEKERKYKELSDLLEVQINTNLPSIIDRDIEQYETYFSYCSIYDIENGNCLPIPMPKGFTFCHSGRFVCGLTKYDIYGIYSQFSIIDAIIYNRFISYADVENVNSIDEILENYPDEEEIEIICSLKYYTYLHSIKGITYDGDYVIYKGIRIKYIFERSISDYILIKSDIKKCIFRKTLTIDNKEKYDYREDDEENSSITIFKNYEPKFYINRNTSIKVYSIIGIQNDL